MENGSISNFLGEIATGSADLAPELETGSQALDYLPQAPSDVFGGIVKLLGNFGS